MDAWETVRERLAAAGLEDLAQPLAALARPCVRYRVEASKGSARSQAGGTPLVPHDFVWLPTKRGPLAFVAQLDLAQVQEA